MKKEIRTKAEMVKSGSSCVLSILFVLGIILYFVNWPLAAIVAIVFIYWLFASSKEISKYENSGEVYLGSEKIGLLDLDKLTPSITPFAVVIDVETTGLLLDDSIPTIKKVNDNPDWYPRIVQIAWMTLSRKYEIVEKHVYYIKQEENIPEEAIKIHGITNEICNDKGEDIKDILRNSISDCDYLVGHNVMFDKYVIEAEFLKNSMPKPFKNMKRYDTMMMGRGLLKRKRFKLEDLAKKVFGTKSLEDNKITFHNAFSDVWITASIFSVLHKNNIKY